MTRSKKDQPGGHPWPGYNRENSVVKAFFRRKRRQANRVAARDYIPCPHCDDIGEICDQAGEVLGPCSCLDNERLEPNPEKSSGGWYTW